MPEIIIDESKCDKEDCLDCVDLCPNECLEYENEKVISKNMDNCSLCETCVDLCPNECLKLKE